MPKDIADPERIEPHQLTQSFDRIRAIPHELERNLELAQLCHSTASKYSVDAATIQQLYEQYSREAGIPAIARPLLRASRRIWTTQEALKNIALISVIASAISFFAAQNEARTLFIQRQLELAETGPRVGPIRKSAIETLTSRGFNLGKLQANNLFLADLRLPLHARLQGADFSSSNLYGASLISANLYYANFSRLPNGPHTNLENSNLSGSDLRQASFKGAYMKETCLRGANLEKAKLDRAVVTKADFRGSKNLTASQLRNAINAKTALYDSEIAKSIGAPIPSPLDAQPASCRLPAMPRNLLTWLSNALQ